MSLSDYGSIQSKNYTGKSISIQAGGVGTNLINFSANDAASAYNLKYPNTPPAINQVLRIDGADTTQFIWDDMGAGGMSPSITIGKLPTVPVLDINGANHTWTDAEFLKGVVKRTGGGALSTDTLGSVTATTLKTALENAYTDLSVDVGTYFELLIYKDVGLALFNWNSGATNITDSSVVDTFLPSTEMLAGNGMTLRFVFTEILIPANPASANRITVYTTLRVV